MERDVKTRRSRRNRVSKYAAIAMKQLGYDCPCFVSLNMRTGESVISGNIKNSWLADHICSVPTLSDAIEWFIEKGFIIYTDANASGFYWSISKVGTGSFIADLNGEGPNEGGCFDSYVDSMSDGIDNLIQLIIKQKSI